MECCIQWLARMDRETQAINAPVIGFAVSPEHLEKVRTAMRERIAQAKRGKQG